MYTERHTAEGVIKSKDDSLVIWGHFTGTNRRGTFLQNIPPTEGLNETVRETALKCMDKWTLVVIVLIVTYLLIVCS